MDCACCNVNTQTVGLVRVFFRGERKAGFVTILSRGGDASLRYNHVLFHAIRQYVLVSLLAKLMQGGVPPVLSKSYIKRVTATDGLGDPLKGICVFFVRPNISKQVSTSNIVEVCKYCSCNIKVTLPLVQEVYSGVLDTCGGRSILQAIEEYLSCVMVPAVTQGQKWGSVLPKQVEEFTASLKQYTLFLKSKLFSFGLDCESAHLVPPRCTAEHHRVYPSVHGHTS